MQAVEKLLSTLPVQASTAEALLAEVRQRYEERETGAQPLSCNLLEAL